MHQIMERTVQNHTYSGIQQKIVDIRIAQSSLVNRNDLRQMGLDGLKTGPGHWVRDRIGRYIIGILPSIRHEVEIGGDDVHAMRISRFPDIQGVHGTDLLILDRQLEVVRPSVPIAVFGRVKVHGSRGVLSLSDTSFHPEQGRDRNDIPGDTEGHESGPSLDVAIHTVLEDTSSMR